MDGLIVYEDKRVLVVSKPRGVATPQVPELVRRALGDETAAARPVHRLDQTVGGLLVLARSRAADSLLSRQVESGAFEKTYLAVIHGRIEPDSGILTDTLLRNTARRVTEAVPPDTPGGKRAELEYETPARAGELTLLRIRLHTGRTHQIRVQLASRGLPIVGDRKYGVPDGAEQIALWSHEVCFDHPETGKHMAFRLPPPDEWPWTEFSQ